MEKDEKAQESPEKPRVRKPYVAPRVLSTEPLEAVASTCNPPVGGFGKSVPLCSPGMFGS